jgi:hypothetical protein
MDLLEWPLGSLDVICSSKGGPSSCHYLYVSLNSSGIVAARTIIVHGKFLVF